MQDSTTVANKVKRTRASKWICGSAYFAAWIPIAICAALVTTTWFLLFWFFRTTFDALFPVSQFYWQLLGLLLVQVGLFDLHRYLTQERRRAELFSEFSSACLSLATSSAVDAEKATMLAQLPLMYVYYHRDKSNAAAALGQTELFTVEPASQLNVAIARAGGDAVLHRAWNASVLLEKQRQPVLSVTMTRVTAWLFCISVPWVFWSYYGWFGYFGCLLVQWPLLALAYAGTLRINHFASHIQAESWFLTLDYERLAKRRQTEINSILQERR